MLAMPWHGFQKMSWYNSIVVGMYKTEWHAGRVVMLNVLQIAVFNHFSIASKKFKCINRGFAAMDTQEMKQDKN
jgi:hypothetical protein